MRCSFVALAAWRSRGVVAHVLHEVETERVVVAIALRNRQTRPLEESADRLEGGIAGQALRPTEIARREGVYPEDGALHG